MVGFRSLFDDQVIEQVIEFKNNPGGNVEIIYPIPWGRLSLFVDVEKAEFRVTTKKLFRRARTSVHAFINFGRIDVNCEKVMKFRHRRPAKPILTYRINLIDKNEINFWRAVVEDKKEFDRIVELINLVVAVYSPNSENNHHLKTCQACGRKINQASKACVFCGGAEQTGRA